MGVIWWTDEEREILINLYSMADKKTILKTFKNKTWYAVQKEADRLGLKRSAQKRGRPKKKPNYFLSKKKLEKLLSDTDLTIDEIAAKLKTTPDIVRRNIIRHGL